MFNEIKLAEENVLMAEIAKDKDGTFGLYIVPDRAEEICISEKELRAAVAKIKAAK